MDFFSLGLVLPKWPKSDFSDVHEIRSYSSFMAFSEQFSTHDSHSAHASGSVTFETLSSSVKHSLGHTSTHVPQPVHFDSSTIGGIINFHPFGLLSFPHRAGMRMKSQETYVFFNFYTWYKILIQNFAP